METNPLPARSSDYARVARAIDFLRASAPAQPELAEVAAAAGLSPFHLQRLFTRWAGISPKRFLQILTLAHARELLAGSADVLSASLECGLSGPGRLHDLFVNLEAFTPGDFKRLGAGCHIQYGFHPSPFGECLLGLSARGVCFLEFPGDLPHAEALATLSAAWPEARLEENPAATVPTIAQIFDPAATPKASLSLLVRGTNFQVKVWQALLRIPPGRVVSYAGIARWIGRETACRAVGHAIGANPIAWIIPCHRVLKSDGTLGGYHWGPTRKAACLAWEQARLERDAHAPG